MNLKTMCFIFALAFVFSTDSKATEYQCMGAAKRMAGNIYIQATGLRYDQAVVTSKYKRSDNGAEVYEISVFTYARAHIKYKVSAIMGDWSMDRCNIHLIEEID